MASHIFQYTNQIVNAGVCVCVCVCVWGGGGGGGTNYEMM